MRLPQMADQAGVLGMRLSRIWFAAGWLSVAVGFVLVLVGIWAGAMKGRSIYYQEMARRRAEEAEATAKRRGSMSYQEIASQHAKAVEVLDGLMHPYEVINGKVSYPLFTDGYYRDPEEYRRRWRRERDWHARMAEKYDHAARDPWLPVGPDPPGPQ